MIFNSAIQVEQSIIQVLKDVINKGHIMLVCFWEKLSRFQLVLLLNVIGTNKTTLSRDDSQDV